MEMIRVGLIGCGSFAREVHLPNLMADTHFRLRAAADVNLKSARKVAEVGQAEYWTDRPEEVFADPAIDAVIIATPHFNHAELAIAAANNGKHVFCEKPMGLSAQDCWQVAQAVREAKIKYTAGYNRCMAPFTKQARRLLAELDAPILINHRIADWFPYSSGWLTDQALSGGRVVGEAGHALDMICHLVGKAPVRVYAEGGNLVRVISNGAPDSALITLGFDDGSAGVLFLSSIANNGLAKEEVLVSCANHTLQITNFERMVIFSPEGEQVFTLPKDG